MAERQSIIIVGVSTRSAAASCVRAGLHPICLDLFCDRDLREYADVQLLHDLDDAFESFDTLQSSVGRKTPVMYVGGVENRPALIEHFESRWKLWGCGSRAVRAVRDPIVLASALREAGLPALNVQLDPSAANGDWLRKPLRSGGGLGIERWNARSRRAHLASGQSNRYFQEYRVGQPMSALFASPSRESGRCELLGVCRQLVGEGFLHAIPFGWCGSIGPVDVEAKTRSQLLAIGVTIHREFQFAGLIGVDFVLDADGIPWVTEVNPRYTGSTEVLELARHASLIQAHSACFEPELPSPAGRGARAEGPQSNDSQSSLIRAAFVGKGVLFASRDLVVRTDDWPLPAPDTALPAVVDVPIDGQLIPQGAPVCSILVRGEGETECLAQLRQLAAQIEDQLGD